MAKKIGKYYITLNNPRNLLLQIKELKDNWNELEEWLKSMLKETDLDLNNTLDEDEISYLFQKEIYLNECLIKMKEIEEGKNE